MLIAFCNMQHAQASVTSLLMRFVAVLYILSHYHTVVCKSYSEMAGARFIDAMSCIVQTAKTKHSVEMFCKQLRI